MSGVSINLRLNEIAAKVPGAAAAALRAGIGEAETYLGVNMPFLTGYMQSEHYSRVINQYAAEIVSPVWYTSFQESGFFNVRAHRFIPGRWFMKTALEILTEVTVESLEGFIDRL